MQQASMAAMQQELGGLKSSVIAKISAKMDLKLDQFMKGIEGMMNEKRGWEACQGMSILLYDVA